MQSAQHRDRDHGAEPLNRGASALPNRVMCGGLRGWQGLSSRRRWVGAAMCSACLCGSH